MEQHHNPANAQSHRETTAEEIWRDTEGRIDIFVHGLGSCGTITGVAQALKQRKPSLRFIGVEPEGAALLSQGEFRAHRLLGIGPGFVPDLFDRALTPADRLGLSEETGLAESDLLEYVRMADLARILGVGPVFVRLYRAAGVGSLEDLSGRSPEELWSHLHAVNYAHGLSSVVPWPRLGLWRLTISSR